MTETTDLSPLDAVRVLRQARDYETELRTRTGGLTWMIWGFATCGIFLTYAFTDVLHAQGWWTGFLWLPWVAAAILTVNAVWHSAALGAPSLRTMDHKQFWLRCAAISLAYFVLLEFLPITGPAQALVFVGLTWFAMGILGVTGRNSRGAPAWIGPVVGIATAAAGAILLWLHPAIEVEGTVAIVASGVFPFTAGLYLTHFG